MAIFGKDCIPQDGFWIGCLHARLVVRGVKAPQGLKRHPSSDGPTNQTNSTIRFRHDSWKLHSKEQVVDAFQQHMAFDNQVSYHWSQATMPCKGYTGAHMMTLFASEDYIPAYRTMD